MSNSNSGFTNNSPKKSKTKTKPTNNSLSNNTPQKLESYLIFCENLLCYTTDYNDPRGGLHASLKMKEISRFIERNTKILC